ncbi:hypothetical protein V8J88_20900 [Massilia sp. W12]|uniref:hypothetical protein n=1 Tax=Massilia sp. W12 TaxID=3126507 RepID=UPI0030CC1AEE
MQAAHKGKQMTALPAQPQRSSLVSGLAWLLIIVGGFSIVIALLQILAFSFIPPEKFASMVDAPKIPFLIKLIFTNLHLIFFSFGLLSCATLICGVGLLLRKYWGWFATILLLVFGIVWNFGMLFLQNALFAAFTEMAPELAETTIFAMFKDGLLIGFSIFALIFSALLLWLIKRLTAPEIREEFQPKAM